jgi:hypothetical protein
VRNRNRAKVDANLAFRNRNTRMFLKLNWIWILYAFGLFVLFLVLWAIYDQLRLWLRKKGWTREAFVEEFQ